MRSVLAIMLLLLPAAATAGSAPLLPDPARTPGAINPAVTQDTIKQTICRPGWTKTIRPPASYTNRLKRQQLAAWHYADRRPGLYEQDHLISLELGGHPIDPRNEWPQAYAGRCGARAKDQVETGLKRLVCSGRLGLEAAQRAIAENWIEACRRYVPRCRCKA